MGPGLGSLTKALLESQANVIAIEKDKDLMNRLGKLAEDVALRVVPAIISPKVSGCASIQLSLLGAQSRP